MRQSTIADVKGAASRVWSNAVTVNVVLVPDTLTKMYRVSAIAEHYRLLGRLDGATLDDLRSRLEARLKTAV